MLVGVSIVIDVMVIIVRVCKNKSPLAKINELVIVIEGKYTSFGVLNANTSFCS